MKKVNLKTLNYHTLKGVRISGVWNRGGPTISIVVNYRVKCLYSVLNLNLPGCINMQ